MSAGQKIKITLASREYPLVAATPQMEQLMRMAAEDVNAKFVRYGSQSPMADDQDKMAFVAENEAVLALRGYRQINSVKAEAEALEKELSDYIAKIEKSR